MLLIVYRVSSNHGKPKEYFSNALNQKWPILKRKHARDVWLRRWKELANVTFNLAQLSRWKKYSDTNIERLRLLLKESWMKLEAKNVQQRTKRVFLRVSHFVFYILFQKNEWWPILIRSFFVFRWISAKRRKGTSWLFSCWRFCLRRCLSSSVLFCWLLTSATSLRCKNRRKKILFVPLSMEDKSQYLLPAREKSLNQVDQISEPLQKINFVFFSFQKFCSLSFKLYWSTFCSSFIGKKWIKIRRVWVF